MYYVLRQTKQHSRSRVQVLYMSWELSLISSLFHLCSLTWWFRPDPWTSVQSMWVWLHLYFCILLFPLLFYLNILRKCLMGITNLEWILTELISIPKCVSIKVSPNFDNFTLPVWQTINSSLTCITFLFLRCIYLFYLLCTQCSGMYAFMTEKGTKSHYRSLWTNMLVAGYWTQNLWKPLSISPSIMFFSVPHFILNFIYNTFQKILMGWGMKTCPNKDLAFSFWYAFASQSLLSNPLLRTWSSPPLLLTWGLCPFFYYFACPPYTPEDLGEPKSACNPWVQKPSLALQGTQSAVLTVTLKAM